MPECPSGHRIRTAELADIPACCRLLDQLFALEADCHFDAGRAAAGLERLLHRGDDAVVLVAAQPSGVVGMLSLQVVISTVTGGASAWLEDLIVDAAHRSQGIGRALLAAAAQWCRAHQITRSKLLADQDNRPALAFYRHAGWQPERMQVWRWELA